MKQNAILFLQVLIILVGMATIILMLWEPHLEGRNAHASIFAIYFKDPFLAYAYIASIPFFLVLYQAFKVLGAVGQNKVRSPAVVKALRTIRYSAITLIAFVAIGEIFILLNHGNDDPAGAVFIGILITLGAVIIAVASTVCERILQKGSKKSRTGQHLNDMEHNN